VVPETLSGDRLVLSVPVDSDLDRIAEYCIDPEFERYLTTPWPYTRAHAESFVRDYVPAAWHDDSEYTWAIREGEDGPLLGMISWRRRGDLGYWMGAPHRGKGYTSEAVAIVIEWVFGTGLATRIRWESFAGNLASARVAQRAGFRFAGTGPLEQPARDGSHPGGWHAVLERDDDRAPTDGWPL
jgi:RimJ/RimL family protein N-acetyltransferase